MGNNIKSRQLGNSLFRYCLGKNLTEGEIQIIKMSTVQERKVAINKVLEEKINDRLKQNNAKHLSYTSVKNRPRRKF